MYVSDFECSNESSPNSSCHFWNHKVRVYSNFASLFSVMKDDSGIFLAQTSYTLDKNSPPKPNFWTFEWLGGLKFTKFLMSYLKLQVSFSLNFGSLFNFSVFFLAKNLYDFYKRSSSKLETFRLSVAQVKFHQICTLMGSFCWKYINFQLTMYRGVMSHDTEE